MKSIIYAWRNIWRNGSRTWITIAAVGINTALLIISFGLMDGMAVDMVRNATQLVVGDAQVHHQEYRADRSFYKVVDDPRSVMQKARSAGVHAAARSYGFGLISSGNKSAGANFWGVIPEDEKSAFDLAHHVRSGNYLPDSPEGQIVLGSKLAKSLNATVGTELVAVVQAADGSLGNELYRVSGILKSAGEDVDRSAAILHAEDFERLFVSGSRVHEVALNAKGNMTAQHIAAVMADDHPGRQVSTWRQLMPQLAGMLEMFDGGLWIFGAIFFLAAALGVMNTMLMATYERIREFGILKALGATPYRILKDVCTEALVMALVAVVSGLVIGLSTSLYLQSHGIDLSIFGAGDISFTGIAFNPIWSATVNLRVVLMPVLIMTGVCVGASVYPAAKAARLDPVRAMNHV